jgi:signal transduction histidine kinase
VTHLDAKAATVLVDRNQLVNVLLNLALNARDAMPEGGQLTITTACRPARSVGAERATRSSTGEDVCISIADTGMGMSDEVRNRAFEPFFTTKQEGLGSGLGLSMVHGFVQQSKGAIEVDSKVGEGTRFTIRLPRIEATDRADEDPAPDVAATGREKSVLLVEDDPEWVVMAASWKVGYRHAVANDEAVT